MSFTQIPPIAVRLEAEYPSPCPFCVSRKLVFHYHHKWRSWKTLTPPSVTKRPSKPQKPPQLLTSCLLTPNTSSAWPHQSCQPPTSAVLSVCSPRPGGPAHLLSPHPLLVQPRHPPCTHWPHPPPPSPICQVRGRGIKKPQSSDI